MPSQFEQYRVDERTEFSANFWNSIFGNVDARIASIENLRQELDAAVENLNQVALARINDILAPAITAIQRTQSLGFLIATSSTPLTLATSGVFTFTCTGDTAATFTPSPFVAIQRTSNYTDYAIARTSSYDRLNGRFICQIMATFGAIDGTKSFNDWQIQGSPGVVLAEQKLLDDTRAARDTAVAKGNEATKAFTDGVAAVNAAVATATQTASNAAATATTQAGTATTQAGIATTQAGTATTQAGIATTQAGVATQKASEVASQIAAIAGGPVASVNGKTGIAFTEVVEAMGGVNPTLDLHLTQRDGLPLGLFTRASTAMRRRENGTLEIVDINVPRIEHSGTGVNLGMLFEPARTNLLLNSAAPATQNVSLGAGTYTLSVAGSGSAVLSGGPTGTATDGAPVTFTLAGTTLVTVTVSGTLDVFQLENGNVATSFISYTGSGSPRAADRLIVPAGTDWYNPVEGTLFVEFIHGVVPSGGPKLFGLGDTTTSIQADRTAAGAVRVFVGAEALYPDLLLSPGARGRLAIAYRNGEARCSLNGTTVVSAAPALSMPATTNLAVGSGVNGQAPAATTLSRMLYAPRALGNAVLLRMTA